MTAEGLAALTAEVERLETVDRPRISAEIKVAREFGDLKENAEYHAAKDAQGMLEAKIKRLRERMDHANVVEKSGGDSVSFGSVVTVVDQASGKETTYTLVSAQEALPAEGKISVESPIATALRDKRVGDVATLRAPRGVRELKITAIS